MKQIVAFSLVASLASGWVCASRALCADQQTDTAVKDTLVQIEHQWTDAAIKGDVAAFGRFIADEWILTYSDGTLVTKPMALADVKKDVNDADLLRLARDAQNGRDAAGVAFSTGAARGDAA